MQCTLCPRECKVIRENDRGKGYCGMGRLPVVSRVAAHHWEEPCISGKRGSGTVFFAGCCMRCKFCQNSKISHTGNGVILTPKQLACTFKKVEELGVHNVNLVNPTHFADTILEALSIANLNIPVVWNTSGYEKIETIKMTKGLVDIFLPDFKFMNIESANVISHSSNYPNIAKEAIKCMCQISGKPLYDCDGIMLKGTLIRHLVLPLRINESLQILEWIKNELPQQTPVSIMSQYTPMNNVKIIGLDRKITSREYKRVVDAMMSLEMPGYIQDRQAADPSFTPTFMDEESLKLLNFE